MSDKIDISPGDWVVHRFQLSAPTVKRVASVSDDKFTVDSEYGPIWFDRSGVLIVSEHKEGAEFCLALEIANTSRRPAMPGKVSKTVTTTTRIKLLEEEIEEILKKACGFDERATAHVDWDGGYGYFAEVVAATAEEEDPA